MEIPTRRRLVLILTGIFLFQTWMVYGDPTARAADPLSEHAAQGRELWHRNNCQSCHQLYGFGGFLGPDLTNYVGRVGAAADDPATREAALAARLQSVLTTGSERMPAFHMDAEERAALGAFLSAMNETGVGQIVLAEVQPPRQVFENLLAGVAALEPPGELVLAGQRVVAESGCIDCHLPNARSAFRATDLTRVHGTLDAARVAHVLSAGIPEKGMPPLALDAERQESVVAFLEYLARHGADLRSGFENAERNAGGSLLDLPWFEYR